MFSQVDTYLQQKLISSSSTNYAYKSMIDTLLFSKSNCHTTEFQSQLFYRDTVGTLDNTSPTNTPLNQGLIYRNVLGSLSKVFDMKGPLTGDIFKIDKYLINGVEIKIKMWQQKKNFRLMLQMLPKTTK